MSSEVPTLPRRSREGGFTGHSASETGLHTGRTSLNVGFEGSSMDLQMSSRITNAACPLKRLSEVANFHQGRMTSVVNRCGISSREHSQCQSQVKGSTHEVSLWARVLEYSAAAPLWTQSGRGRPHSRKHRGCSRFPTDECLRSPGDARRGRANDAETNVVHPLPREVAQAESGPTPFRPVVERAATHDAAAGGVEPVTAVAV